MQAPFIKALRSDGQPLTFGYEVNDMHGHNIGVVGGGSQIFIRTNEIQPAVNVAIDKQQGLSCTITFGKEIDESKNYICRWEVKYDVQKWNITNIYIVG